LIKLTFILGVSALAVSFVTNYFLSDTRKDWIEQSTLGNKILTPITAWLHTLIGIAFSFYAFKTIFELRDDAIDLYKETQRERCKYKDFEWLKARTLHVRGLLPNDRRGDLLKNELNIMLEPVKGQVLDVVVIPDYQVLFDLETEKKELEDLNLMVRAHGTPGCFMRCCFGVLWTNGDLR
jgi:hypothetical protein